MNPADLKSLLEQVRTGGCSPDDAMRKLQHLPFLSMQDALIDSHRQVRTGFPEAVYGASKTFDQIERIVEGIINNHAAESVLVTRVDAGTGEKLAKRFPPSDHDVLAGTVLVHPHATLPAAPSTKIVQGDVVILCAGTSDLPVAREAWQTLRTVKRTAALVADVGVAGLHRILSRLDDLQQAGALIVVAGMDGALPSVAAGLVACPVIAVPTSVGYGAAFQGIAPLLTMLNSCAPGVTVVGIDNGFGAAVSALRILK